MEARCSDGVSPSPQPLWMLFTWAHPPTHCTTPMPQSRKPCMLHRVKTRSLACKAHIRGRHLGPGFLFSLQISRLWLQYPRPRTQTLAQYSTVFSCRSEWPQPQTNSQHSIAQHKNPANARMHASLSINPNLNSDPLSISISLASPPLPLQGSERRKKN